MQHNRSEEAVESHGDAVVVELDQSLPAEGYFSMTVAR